MESNDTKIVSNPPEIQNGENTSWYVLRIISGKERKVKEFLEKEAIRNNWQNVVKQFFLPIEKVYKVHKGKKILKERNYFPGYLMVEIFNNNFNDEVVHQISVVNNVMHFLTDGKGSKGKIIALRKTEVNKMLGKADEMNIGEMKINEPFIIGESVKIIEGPFNGFIAVIEEIKDEKKKLVLSVKIFERTTPMEFSFFQVEKIN